MTVYQPSPRYVPRHGSRYLPYAKQAPSQGSPGGTPSGGAVPILGQTGFRSPALQQQAATTSGSEGFDPATFDYNSFAQGDTGAAAPVVTAPDNISVATFDATQEIPFASDTTVDVADYTDVASDYGYEQGTQNPAGLVGAGLTALGVPGGSFLSDFGGGDFTYGNPGTTDQYGNIFGGSPEPVQYEGDPNLQVTGTTTAGDPFAGSVSQFLVPENRRRSAAGRLGRSRGAFNPITGRSTASYGSYGDALSTIGQSGLGNYANSITGARDAFEALPGIAASEVPDINTAEGRALLRGARYRGVVPSALGVTTTAGRLSTAEGPIEVTNRQLGFDGTRAGPIANTGQFGTGTGDIVGTEQGLGVINEDGTISTAQGTVVSLSDSANPGQSISLLNSSPEARQRAQQELSLRTTKVGRPAATTLTNDDPSIFGPFQEYKLPANPTAQSGNPFKEVNVYKPIASEISDLDPYLPSVDKIQESSSSSSSSGGK